MDMNAFRVVVFGFCFGLLSSCEQVNRWGSNGPCGSDKPHEAPNGLNNNWYRCYANAGLQLLAACFSEEIKNVKPFKSDSKKEQMRLDLCTIVDHINARGNRYTGDKKVMGAVRRLTRRFNTGFRVGGYVDEFVEGLNKELKFLPDLMFIDYLDTFYYKVGGPISNLNSKILGTYGPFVQGGLVSYIGLRLDDEIAGHAELSNKALEDYWKLKKMSEWHSNEQNLEGFESVIKNLHKRSRYDKIYSVTLQFYKLKKKPSPGTKFITTSFQNSQDRELTCPYEAKPGCWQQFNLVGFVVQLGWHFVTYVKRGGMWYQANDAKVFPVTEEAIDQELKKCSKDFGSGVQNRFPYRALSVYEAKD